MKSKYAIGALLILISACGEKGAVNKVSSLTAGQFITDSSNNCASKTCQNYRKEFDLVVATGKKIYCYWDLKKTATGNDYELIAKGLKQSITDTTTKYEYYLLLQKWAGSLQDGHVNAMWGEDRDALESYKVPLKLEMLSPGTDHEKLIVSEASSHAKNIPVGSIITKINGKETKTVVDNLEKYLSGSTSRMRRATAGYMVFSIMDSREEEKSAVKIEYTYNGQTQTAELPRLITLPFTPKKALWGDEEVVDYAKLIQARILPNNIGYLRIDGFLGEEMGNILSRTMNLLSHTKALVIDMRYNGGGNQSGTAILGWLSSKEIVRYHYNLRISDRLLVERGDLFIEAEYNDSDEFIPFAPMPVVPSEKNYKGKVFVLTSSNCFSACDTFVSALQENKLATIVGEGTGGGTGSPHNFDLPLSGLRFRYSVAQGLTAVRKTFIEGVGTLPDVLLEPTLEERIAGIDEQLLKTINLAAEATAQKVIGIDELKDSGITPVKTGDSYSISDYDLKIKSITE